MYCRFFVGIHTPYTQKSEHMLKFDPAKVQKDYPNLNGYWIGGRDSASQEIIAISNHPDRLIGDTGQENGK